MLYSAYIIRIEAVRDERDGECNDKTIKSTIKANTQCEEKERNQKSSCEKNQNNSNQCGRSRQKRNEFLFAIDYPFTSLN